MKQTLLLLFLACDLAGAQEPLLPNGGFEAASTGPMLAALTPAVREFYGGAADSPFAGWAFGGRWERGDYAVAVSDVSHGGQRACQMTCRRKGRGGIASAPLTLPAGTTIEISGWTKGDGAAGGRVFLNLEGTPGDGWDSRDLKTGTYDWNRFVKRATVPGEGQQTVIVFLYTTCEGSVYVDDMAVSIAKDGAAAEPGSAKRPRPIAEPAGSPGYRVSVVSALDKVFREDDYAAEPVTRIALSAARNEVEAAQLVVEAPWRPVTIEQVRCSDLRGPGGATVPADALSWQRVDYVETTVTPPYYTERGLGWYPDPLLPAGPFTVARQSRAPLWLSLRTPRDCPAGAYSGTVTVQAAGLPAVSLPLTLTVWDFALTDETHLRTMTWLGGGVLREWYGHDWSAQGERDHAVVRRRYEDCLLAHRLGPGGEVATDVAADENGRFDFRRVDESLDRLLRGGMNAFIMGTAPNLGRQNQKAYSPEFVAKFTTMLRAYSEHLRAKGWLDKAYVYVWDEAPKSAWPEVKRIDQAIHAAAPSVRILQCLNEPEGVRELTGFADVFDVYVAQYHKTGVAASQARGAEAWLAVCCYPMDHPNFFLEYPLVDVRVTPWICWKYKAAGFEYWSPNAWGANWQRKGDKWPKVPWTANTFGRYNGDGYLLYPGADGQPYSSLRLEALRDGLEDYEYLWTLRERLKARPDSVAAAARDLLTLGPVVSEAGGYAEDHAALTRYRARVAEAIVALGRQ